MREIYVSRAGDKALTRETPTRKGGGLTGMEFDFRLKSNILIEGNYAL